MLTPRRTLATTALVLLLAVGGSPVHAVEFVDAAPEVVDAEVTLQDAELATSTDGRRSEPVAAPIDFTGLWVELDRETTGVRVRTSTDGSSWTAWSTVGLLDDDDGPDLGTDEAQAADDTAHVSELVITDPSTHFQIEVDREVTEARVHLADSSGANDSMWVRAKRVLSRAGVPAAEASTVPDWVVPRRDWGADEANTRTPSIASGGVGSVVVHHTASRNDYTPDGVPNEIRIFQRYHMSLGWSDIGYNALVDRFGRVYEGRRGGLDRAVIGAHARGYNTGSFGVAVIGNYSAERAPQVAIDALSDVISYKAAIHGFDPAGVTTSGGRARPVIVGHQDVGQTSCPGRIQEQLPEIRTSSRSTSVAELSPFTDIHGGNTHGASVLGLYEQGIVHGCTLDRFCPTNDLTRAQAASLIARSLGLMELDVAAGDDEGTDDPEGRPGRAEPAEPDFDDVTLGSTHAAAIGAVSRHEIVNGFDDGTFRPAQPLTREQMASFLARAMELAPVAERRFVDVASGSVHGGNVNAVARSGVTQGCTEESFCPRDRVTRAQMASFVDRMLRTLVR